MHAIDSLDIYSDVRNGKLMKKSFQGNQITSSMCSANTQSIDSLLMIGGRRHTQINSNVQLLNVVYVDHHELSHIISSRIFA